MSQTISQEEPEDFLALLPVMTNMSETKTPYPRRNSSLQRVHELVSRGREVGNLLPEYPLQNFLKKLELLKLTQSKIFQIDHTYSGPVKASLPKFKRSSLSIKNIIQQEDQTTEHFRSQLEYNQLPASGYIITNKSLPKSGYHSGKHSRLLNMSTRNAGGVINNDSCLVRKNTMSHTKMQPQFAAQIKQPKYKFIGTIRQKRTQRPRPKPPSPSRDKKLQALMADLIARKASVRMGVLTQSR